MKLIILACLGLALQSHASTSPTAPVDISKSKLEWVGSKPTGKHNGTVNIKAGQVKFDTKGAVTGGTFEFDMSSIDTKDLTGEWKTKLDNHLRSDDFFNVKKYPTAKFELTKVTPKKGDEYDFTGTLTIKDKSGPVTFPGRITNEGGARRAVADLKIDRTKWDIKYNSGKFFDLNKLGDKLINDEIEFKLDLLVTPPQSADAKKPADKKG
jgi:polyisoprenoid-binding protein YceI